MSSVENHQARVVVTGLNAKGRSTIVADENSSTRVVTPTFAVADVWRVDRIPAPVLADNPLNGDVILDPPKGGLLVRTVAFPPDSEWKAGGGYAEAMAAISGAGSHDESDTVAGMHATDTVDIGTVISGEIYAVMQDGEVLLRPGDSFVQRGTKHAWSNRSDKPAVLVVTQVSALR